MELIKYFKHQIIDFHISKPFKVRKLKEINLKEKLIVKDRNVIKLKPGELSNSEVNLITFRNFLDKTYNNNYL